jgi:tetrahydromethanopterin S-methyltransferase subunit G
MEKPLEHRLDELAERLEISLMEINVYRERIEEISLRLDELKKKLD